MTTEAGKGDALLGAGQTLQGAVITNKSAVTLDQVTPLARTVGEFEIIVVPVDSPIQTLDDLVAALKADPGAVSWGGGSVGSTDHIVAGLIMKAIGADLSKLNYIAHSGGGEALTSVLGGHVTVGISGYGEFGPQVESGKLRALALSSEERLPGVDIPTLKEQGVDVAFFNWRGLFAAPDVPAEARGRDRRPEENLPRRSCHGFHSEAIPTKIASLKPANIRSQVHRGSRNDRAQARNS